MYTLCNILEGGVKNKKGDKGERDNARVRAELRVVGGFLENCKLIFFLKKNVSIIYFLLLCENIKFK